MREYALSRLASCAQAVNPTVGLHSAEGNNQKEMERKCCRQWPDESRVETSKSAHSCRCNSRLGTRSQVPPTGVSTHLNLARVRKDTSPRVPPPLATQSLSRVDKTHTTLLAPVTTHLRHPQLSQSSKKLSGSCLLALPIAACPAVIVTTLQLRSTARRRTRPGFTIGRPLTASLGPIGGPIHSSPVSSVISRPLTHFHCT